MPERIRKIQVFLPMVEMGWLLVNRATDHAKIRITTVRIAVAKFESTCSTPTLASTAVSPAKNAESNAQMNQFISFRPPSSQAALAWQSAPVAHNDAGNPNFLI